MKKYLLPAILLVCTGPVFAGWKIVREVRDEEGNRYESVMYFQDGRVRIEEGSSITIFNQREGKMILYNSEKKKYWSGNKDDFRREIEAQIEKAMIDAMGEDAYKEYKSSIEADKIQPGDAGVPALDLSIEKDNNSEEISGFQAFRFLITVDGEKTEELWLCRDIDVIRDVDFQVMNEFFSQEDDMMDYTNAKAYSEMLQKNGFPIREIHYSFGEVIEEINLKSAEKKNVPSAIFDPPAGAQKASLKDLIGEGY